MTQPAILQAELARLIERELARGAAHAAERAAEGLYGWTLDHPDVSLDALANALRTLVDSPRLAAPVRRAARLLAEPTPEDASLISRAEARRRDPHASPLELARLADTEALRRLPARALRLALQAATPAIAPALIDAWNALPLHEQERT